MQLLRPHKGLIPTYSNQVIKISSQLLPIQITLHPTPYDCFPNLLLSISPIIMPFVNCAQFRVSFHLPPLLIRQLMQMILSVCQFYCTFLRNLQQQFTFLDITTIQIFTYLIIFNDQLYTLCHDLHQRYFTLHTVVP